MLILALMIVLSGCVSDTSYSQYLQQWVGMSQEALYHSWGMPQNELYLSPSQKEITYLKTFPNPVNGNTQPYQNIINYSAIDSRSFGDNDNNQDYYCQTSFTIENNKVVNFSFNGDDCVVSN